MATLRELSQQLPKYPTCPNCGDHVLREHLNQGQEVCRFCGPTRDLDTYGELEKEVFNNWRSQQ